MPLPEPKRFRITDLAKRWGQSEEDIRELIRDGQFKHLIVYTHGPLGGFTKQYFITDKVPPDNDTFSSKPNILAGRGSRDYGCYVSSIEEFPWPSEESILYIPRTEVKAFEKEHGISPNRKLKQLEAAEIDAQPVSNAASDPSGQAWIPTAKMIAMDIVKDLAKKHKYQNQNQVAEKVRIEMERKKSAGEPGVSGRGGRIPSADSIKRRALKGIILRHK